MEKIRIDVVGLAHWDVRSQWKEYAAGAVGRELVLQPQPEKMIDPYAVRAREGRLQEHNGVRNRCAYFACLGS